MRVKRIGSCVHEVAGDSVRMCVRSTSASSSRSESRSVSDDGVEISLGVVGSYAGNSGAGAVGSTVIAVAAIAVGLV